MENFCQNMTIIHFYIKLRDYFVNYIYSNILLLVKFDRKYLVYDNKIILFFINLFPYFVIKRLLLFFNINYLYQKDDLIYYSKHNKFSMSPIILDINLKSNGIKKNIKTIYNKYGNNVPLQLIFKNENLSIDDEDIILVKYMSSGKISEKSFNYKKIKLYFKIDLLK